MASPILAELIIMNMNVGKHTRTDFSNKTGKVNRVEVPSQDRKWAIENILKDKNPTLVFVEEFTWFGLHVGDAFSAKGIPAYYRFFGNSDSGFIYDERCLFCERLDNTPSLRRSYGLLIAQQNIEPYFDLSRLCICKIKSVGPPEFELLCVCWHGPHNNFNDPKKKSHLNSLLNFLLIVKAECGNLPLLLGGDFNLGSDKVNGVCEEMSNKLVMLQPKTQGSIMLWVRSVDFDKVFRLSDPNNDMDEELYPSLDHVVLTMKLQIATTVEDLKRSHRLYDFNWDTIVKNTHYLRCHLNIGELTETEDYPGFQMMSVSWHGADAEYSDETKKESLKSAITCLQLEIDKTFPRTRNTIDLEWREVLKDSSRKENIHSSYHTLDTWIFSTDKTSRDKSKSKNTNLKDIRLYLHNNITALINETSRLTPRQKHAPNSSPVDIHLDIVNMVLSRQGRRSIVTGYLNVCSYLSANVLE